MDKTNKIKLNSISRSETDVRSRNDAVLSDPELMSLTLPEHLQTDDQRLFDSIAIFETLCSEDHRCIYAHKVLAYMYVEAQRFDSALAILGKLRRMTHIDDNALVVLNFLAGRAYLGLGNKSKAMLCFEAHRDKLAEL